MKSNHLPNAWSFYNTAKQLKSVNELYKIEYYDLSEIAMGAPLAGKCYLIDKNKNKTLINSWSGGPPIWNTEGTKVAIPIWTKSFFRGTHQKLLVLDLSERELIKYNKSFSVLDLRSFHEDVIYGYDSPIHKTKVVEFELSKEKVESKKKI